MEKNGGYHADEYLHAPHDEYQPTILVTLPEEIRKKYQSCVFESEEYNNSHDIYLQSYKANKYRLAQLEHNQIMFDALCTLHTWHRFHSDTHAVHYMAPWIKNKLRIHDTRSKLCVQKATRFRKYHQMQTHICFLYTLIQDHTRALLDLQDDITNRTNRPYGLQAMQGVAQSP